MSARRLTAEEVAAQLHCEPETVCRKAAAGEIKAFKPGKRWLFEQADVDAYVRSSPNEARTTTTRRRRRRVA